MAPSTPARTQVLPEHFIEGSVCKAASKTLDQVQAEIENLQRSANPNVAADATHFLKEKDKMDGLTWPKDLSKEGMTKWNCDFEEKAMQMSGRIDTQTTVTIRYFANNWKTRRNLFSMTRAAAAASTNSSRTTPIRCYWKRRPLRRSLRVCIGGVWLTSA